MKKMILTLIAFMSFSAFAQMTILTDNLPQYPDAGRKDLSLALIMANGNFPRYGICNLDWVGFDGIGIKVFVTEGKPTSEILIVSDFEWMKLRLNEAQNRIVYGEGGRYVWQRINRGTILKPDFKNTMVVSARANCLQ